MRLRALAVAIVVGPFVGCAIATGSSAAGVDDLIAILNDMGHAVEEETADDGPNLVVDGGIWSISLAECSERADCAYGWVYARRDLEHFVYPECANDWNGQEPFGTAWIDNMSQPWLGITLDFGGEPGPAAIRSSLEWYEAQLARFEAYIETCPPIDRDAL